MAILFRTAYYARPVGMGQPTSVIKDSDIQGL